MHALKWFLLDPATASLAVVLSAPSAHSSQTMQQQIQAPAKQGYTSGLVSRVGLCAVMVILFMISFPPFLCGLPCVILGAVMVKQVRSGRTVAIKYIAHYN